jgi:hypothetical protein
MPAPTGTNRREEIELELLAFELVERKAELALSTFVTVASMAATVIALIDESTWPAPSATGLATVRRPTPGCGARGAPW